MSNTQGAKASNLEKLKYFLVLKTMYSTTQEKIFDISMLVFSSLDSDCCHRVERGRTGGEEEDGREKLSLPDTIADSSSPSRFFRYHREQHSDVL